MGNRVYSIMVIGALIATLTSQIRALRNSSHDNITNDHHERFKVVDWKFEELKNYIIYASFIVVVILMKIAYFHLPRMAKYAPQSCSLVVLGILFGGLVKFSMGGDNFYYFKMTPDLFFYVLLPPVILESSYSLYHRNFLDNLMSILTFAVFGTLLNFLIIGFSLYGFTQIGLMQKLELSLLHCLLFSSLVVAVDPVAVLAIFNEVGVNEDLYYLVYGESLFNNAVIVVLYKIMQEFELMTEIKLKNIILGLVSFFTVPLGGLIIGVVFGVLSCLIIRSMGDIHTVFLEPILLIGMGYMAYLLAEIFGWSGIISIIACGLIQDAYALPGISDKTIFILKRFVKMLASVCEALIFLFLGVEIVIGHHSWEMSFIICSLGLCIASRFVVIFSLSSIVNYIHMSMRNIPLKEKFIISYGGLRGAVAFSLAVLIKPKIFEKSALTNEAIITTTLIIILFTIIVQGMTIKPLVRHLNISTMNKAKKIGLFCELNDSIVDAACKGMQGILGNSGRNYLLLVVERLSEKYFRPFLQGRASNHDKLLEMNEKINAILVSSMSDGNCNKQLKRLPNSYVNLLMTIKNTQTIPEEELIKKHPAIRRMSIRTRQMSLKPLKKLMPYLYRPSAIIIESDEEWHNMLPGKPFNPGSARPRWRSLER